MIQAVKLTKRFEDITAVDHIDAAIREGSVFGLIGTNGAGKSTFLRVIISDKGGFAWLREI